MHLELLRAGRITSILPRGPRRIAKSACIPYRKGAKIADREVELYPTDPNVLQESILHRGQGPSVVEAGPIASE